ncbi:MAG: DUF2807 domain-containing protein [Nonlabens sp.]
MKFKVILIVMFIAYTGTMAQKVKGNRDVTIETTDVAPFTHLLVDEDFEVELIQGNVTKVMLETDSNLHEHINIASSGEKLELSAMADIRSKKRMKVTIYCSENLKMITVVGDSELKSSSQLTFSTLEVVARDKASVNLSLRADNLSVNANGNTRVEISSRGDNLTMNLSQNSFLKADLNYNNCDLSMDHRSDAEAKGKVNSGTVALNENSHLRARSLTWDNLQLAVRKNARAEVDVKDDLIISAVDDAQVTIYNKPSITIDTFSGEAVLKKQD